jgi:monothiol glutaredoxin
MDVVERIKNEIESKPVVLFMKGTPDFPQCGFSARTSQVLKTLGVEFGHVNVLAEPEVRANLPRYSNWPTFPQLFVKNELIGGCDIVVEMFESGELKKLLDEKGIHHA